MNKLSVRERRAESDPPPTDGECEALLQVARRHAIRPVLADFTTAQISLSGVACFFRELAQYGLKFAQRTLRLALLRPKTTA